MASPDISVIIATHNRRDLLAGLLSGLARQALPTDKWEVIIVDDASTDGTRIMLESRAQIWPTALSILHVNHGKAAAVRNAGAAAAKGRILLFVDDDMSVGPGFVAAHMREHSQPDMAVIGRIAPAAGRREPWTAWDDRQLDDLAERLGNAKQAPGPREVYAGNLSIAADLFRAVGGFNEAIERTEDFDLGYKLAANGARFGYCADATSVHHGTHRFDRWMQNATAFGRSEVALARDFGHRSDFGVWYRDRHPLNRLLIKLTSRNPGVRGPLVSGLNLVGRASYAAGAKGMSALAYSAIYNVSYWGGLIEALGPERFWNEAPLAATAESLAPR